ncbi:E3 ubiquitin-protein ligase RNF170 [Gryllus bimaculatus]|nr:E3 ubiquitin-protein ligase RNF170 [Gryllus bimaculatus]
MNESISEIVVMAFAKVDLRQVYKVWTMVKQKMVGTVFTVLFLLNYTVSLTFSLPGRICIRQYYEISNVTVMTCPLCRSNVNMLFIMFTNAEKEDASLEETRQIIYTFVDEYNQRCLLIRRTLVQVILDWPTTMRHLWNELFSINGLMYVTRAPISLCVIAAVVYILSPLDIIPEAVFGLLGLLDDLFVIFLIGLYVSVVYRRLVIMRGAAGNHL